MIWKSVCILKVKANSKYAYTLLDFNSIYIYLYNVM